jgi:putative flippase GtrA
VIDTPQQRSFWRVLLGQLVRFGLVGGSAAALDFAVLMTVIHFGGSRYFSRVISVGMAMVYTWALNRRLTFATVAAPSWREFGHYVAVTLAGVTINLVLYSTALWVGAPVPLAFVIGTGTAAVFNFLRYRILLGNVSR